MENEEPWVPDKMILIFDRPTRIEIASTAYLAEEAGQKGYSFYPCSMLRTKYAIFIRPNYFCNDTVKIDGNPTEISGSMNVDALAMVITLDYIDVVTNPNMIDSLRKEREEIERKLSEIIAGKSQGKGTQGG